MGIGISPGTSNTLPSEVPNGYLKAVFFDKEGNVQAAESQIKFLQTSVSTWQTLELSFTASQNGYLQVYVANKSDQEVFFDDLEVAHTPTLIAQENHYYPYGMNMVGIEKQGMPHNRFQFNAQTERETAFNLHWDETPFRRYDAQIGRFHGVDALASQFGGITPYQYAFNNPVMFNDPTGLLPDATASFGSPGSTFMDEWAAGLSGGVAGQDGWQRRQEQGEFERNLNPWDYATPLDLGTNGQGIEKLEFTESGLWIDFTYKSGTLERGVVAKRSQFVAYSGGGGCPLHGASCSGNHSSGSGIDTKDATNSLAKIARSTVFASEGMKTLSPKARARYKMFVTYVKGSGKNKLVAFADPTNPKGIKNLVDQGFQPTPRTKLLSHLKSLGKGLVYATIVLDGGEVITRPLRGIQGSQAESANMTLRSIAAISATKVPIIAVISVTQYGLDFAYGGKAPVSLLPTNVNDIASGRYFGSFIFANVGKLVLGPKTYAKAWSFFGVKIKAGWGE